MKRPPVSKIDPGQLATPTDPDNNPSPTAPGARHSASKKRHVEVLPPPAEDPADPLFCLDPNGRAKWTEIAGLKSWGIGERDQILAYCLAYQRFVAAQKWLMTPGHGPVITIRDDKGNVKSHGKAPQLIMSDDAAREMARIGKLLRLDRIKRKGGNENGP